MGVTITSVKIVQQYFVGIQTELNMVEAGGC